MSSPEGVVIPGNGGWVEPDLSRAVRELYAPVLRERGFVRKGRNFERVHANGDGEFIMTRRVDYGDWSEVYITVAVQPLILWELNAQGPHVPRNGVGGIWYREKFGPTTGEFSTATPGGWLVPHDERAARSFAAQVEYLREWLPTIDRMSDYRQWLLEAADPPSPLVSPHGLRLEGTSGWWLVKWCVDPQDESCRQQLIACLSELPEDFQARGRMLKRVIEGPPPVARDYDVLWERRGG